MFIIDFNLNKFELSFDGYQDRDDFLDNVNYLKGHFVSYNIDSKKWTIDFKNIEEKLLWFEREGKDFLLTDLAKETLDNFKKTSYQRETEFYRGQEIDYSIFNDGVKLYDFQKEDIIQRLSTSNYLDANDAGLGKSLENLTVASQRFKENKIDGLIIIVPNGLNYHWKYEILNFVNIFRDEDIQIITNENKYRPFDTYKDKKILIISNHAKVLGDCLLSYKKDFKFGDSAKKLRWKSGSFVDIKKEWNKKELMLIADESHAFKYSDTVRTKALHSIKSYFKYKSLLSATPNINEFTHIYPQMFMIDKSIIPYSENSFSIYVSSSIGDKWNKYAITRYNTEKVQEMKKRFKPFLFQRLKEDVPEMKAKKIIQSVYFELTLEQKKMYSLITELELAKLYKEYDVITWKLLLNKLSSIISVMDNPCLLKKETYDNQLLMQLLSKWSIDKDPKFIALNSKLENYIDDRNEKVVLYDYRPDTLDALKIKFEKYNPVIIHGSLTGIKNTDLDRQQKQDIFNNDPKCKLALLSALTSSAGLNLNKSCHRNIVYTMPWDGTAFKQLQERTHRINSIEDTILEIFYYPHTIDNLRVQRNLSRVELNDKLGKEVSQHELENLLNGRV